MKKFVAVFCLLLCAATLQAKDKPNPADFNIKIHISRTFVLAPLGNVLRVDTVLNGKKVILEGITNQLYRSVIHSSHSPILSPGDYQIRLKEDESEKDGSIIRQEYELLLPNGNIWECWPAGISE